MRITKLSLKDFRIYEQETVELTNPLSIFKGVNHSGKSSLAQAIKLALSKCADGTDPRGAGAIDKVRLGANKAIIETVIEGKQGLVTLTTQYGPGKTGRTQKIVTTPESEKVAAGFDKYLDANQERLSCVLDSNYFVSQRPEQQKAILATLVLPTSYEFEQEKKELAEKHLGAFVWDKSPVAVIDQVYEAAYAARRTAKATLAAVRVPQAPVKPEHSAEDVQAKLTKLRAAAAKESKAISGGGTVQIGRIEQGIETGQANLKTLIAEREAAVKQRDALDDLVPDPTTLKEIERRAAGRKLFNQLQAKKGALAAEAAGQREAQEVFAELLQGNADHANCPTCTQSITRKFIDGKIAEHKTLEAEARRAADALFDEQTELGDISGAEKEIEAIAESGKVAFAVGHMIKGLHAKITETENSIAGLVAQLAQAKADVQAPADTAALDKINAEIAEWEARLSPAVNYNATLEQIKRLTAQWVEQKDAVDDLEVLCEHFGKDGIKAELIAKHIGEFSETVNGVLGAWGYSAALQIEPYEFVITTAAGVLPLKELSGSERMMFSVALQTAIAFHSKIRLVVVDAADVLVAQERNRLFACMAKALAGGTLDQAIVLLSEKEDGRTKINKAGVATYWVEAGKVVSL